LIIQKEYFISGGRLSYLKINKMDGSNRINIKPGIRVNIILKKDQRSGTLTEGIVKDILTSAPKHTHGIKVRLEDGQIGRVQEILENK
jgi:uncharacterized repeat protein (TIGR03833 family)